MARRRLGFLTLLAGVLAPARAEEREFCPRQQLLEPRQPICALEAAAVVGARWAHDGVCMPSASAGDRGELCVYNAPSFNEHRGLGVVAGKEVAAAIASAVARQHPAAAILHRSHLFAAERDGNRQQRPANLSYQVRDVAGKGLGVVAVHDIARFDTVMVGFPALIVHRDMLPPIRQAASRGESRARLFQHALEQLPVRERVLDLAQSMRVAGMHPAEDAVRTNAFGVSIGETGMRGLYPEVARINHACDPNTMTSFKDGTLALEVLALRAIAAGEEITLSYIPVGMPSFHRSRALAKWGFALLVLAVVRAPAGERAESDRRRQRIAELLDALAEADDYGSIAHLTREFLALIKTEGLTEKLAEYYHSLTRLAYRHGDLEATSRYGALALEYAEAFGDPDDGLCRSLRKALELVESQRQQQRGS